MLWIFGGPYAIRMEENGDEPIMTEDGINPVEIEHYDDIPGPEIRFLVVELNVYNPGVVHELTTEDAYNSRPNLALALLEDPGSARQPDHRIRPWLSLYVHRCRWHQALSADTEPGVSGG